MKFKKIKVFYQLILTSLSNNNNAIQRMASILKENVPSTPVATGIICRIIITVIVDLSWRPLKIIFWVQKFNVEIYVQQKIKCTTEASTCVTIKEQRRDVALSFKAFLCD